MIEHIFSNVYMIKLMILIVVEKSHDKLRFNTRLH